MTNTPMTSREAFEEYYKRRQNPNADFTRYAPDSFAYKDDLIDELWFPWDDAWECCQSQQASVIAELVEALEAAKEILDSEGVYTRNVAKIDALIAKVKGK